MSIGQNIKSARLKKDMTLEELSRIIGVSRQTLSRYETGVIPNIPPDRARALAEALGVTSDYLHGLDILKGEAQRRREVGEDLGDITYEHALKVVEDEKRLVDLYRELNPEGQEKLIDYADDMVRSGKYIKNNPAGLVEKKA